MSSTNRYYAQKQYPLITNNVKLFAPVGDFSFNNPCVLNLDLASFQLFNVDIRGINSILSDRSSRYFYLNYDTSIASTYPGLEFTVFFDSYGDSSDSAIWENMYVNVATPDMTGFIVLSEAYGLSTNYPIQTATFKSNGRAFSLIGTGPSYAD